MSQFQSLLQSYNDQHSDFFSLVKIIKTGVGKDVEQQESYFANGNIKGATTIEKFGSSSKN